MLPASAVRLLVRSALWRTARSGLLSVHQVAVRRAGPPFGPPGGGLTGEDLLGWRLTRGMAYNCLK